MPRGILKMYNYICDYDNMKAVTELIEYRKLNDSHNVYFYIEEKGVKFKNVVKVINYKRKKEYKKVTVNEIPEIVVYLNTADSKFITFMRNFKYEIGCYLRYHFNDFIESLSDSLVMY